MELVLDRSAGGDVVVDEEEEVGVPVEDLDLDTGFAEGFAGPERSGILDA